MSNEQNPVENQAPVSTPDAATTPIDLAQAFKMLNQTNREAAQEPVETGSPVEENGDANDDAGVLDDPSIDGSTVESSGDQGDGADDGGSSDGIEAIDFNAYKQQLLRDIQHDAASQVRREFNEQNIGYYSAAELTVRDEQTGQIRFRNPDVQDERDPNYYFKSRSELQQFITAWNQGVDYEFRKAVNQKQGELLNRATPTVRLMDFLPKWQAMDKTTKDIFDELLEGHEIRDAQGKEIGFNVDLNAVAAQATKIAKRFKGGQSQQGGTQDGKRPEVPAASGPALDMPTGNGRAADEREPANIGEALKMFDKKNKGGK